MRAPGATRFAWPCNSGSQLPGGSRVGIGQAVTACTRSDWSRPWLSTNLRQGTALLRTLDGYFSPLQHELNALPWQRRECSPIVAVSGLPLLRSRLRGASTAAFFSSPLASS